MPNHIAQDHNDNVFSSTVNTGEKRLLVKLLKAANLNSNFSLIIFLAFLEFNWKITLFTWFFIIDCEEPFCIIELDSPIQKQITTVFKDASLLNEQFLFDITNTSEELIFSIYDRNKDYASK